MCICIMHVCIQCIDGYIVYLLDILIYFTVCIMACMEIPLGEGSYHIETSQLR